MNKPDRLARFADWLDHPPGRELAALEAEAFAALVPGRYYPVAVQFGARGADTLAALSSRRKCYLATPADARDGAVACDFRSLPFAPRSIDVAVLPHTLDFVDDPHALLRELTQSMVPDGHVLVSGFQPFSIWGARKYLRIPGDSVPWSGRFLTTARIQDWLSLMGFRVRGGRMMMYRPPLKRSGVYQKLAFLERAGDRWWPMLGAVYVIHAQLQTLRMIPVAPALKRRAFPPRLAQGATRRMRLSASSRRSW